MNLPMRFLTYRQGLLSAAKFDNLVKKSHNECAIDRLISEHMSKEWEPMTQKWREKPIVYLVEIGFVCKS